MNDVSPIVALLVLIVLVFINGILASAELALVSINEMKLKQKAEAGDKKSKLLLVMKQNPSDFLSTVQIGITLAGLLSGVFAADSFAQLIVDMFSGRDISDGFLSIIRVTSVVLVTLMLTYFMMVFGELVPKRIAIIYPYKTGAILITPIVIFSKITKPFIRFMSFSTNWVLRVIGIDPNQYARPVTEEEILLMVREGREQGTIEKTEEEIVTNLFKFTDLSVEDAMTHRTEIEAIPYNASIEAVVETMSQTSHGKFPIYEGTIDNIVGTIYSKDIVKMYSKKDNEPPLWQLKDVMRQAFFVPESHSLVNLFIEMKQRNNQLAIVVDEYGGTSGIITMMDILEEIVGDFEMPRVDLIKNSGDGGYIIDGRTEINEVIKFLDMDIRNDVNYTLSGFVIKRLGYVPSKGQTPTIEAGGYEFCVREVYGSLIRSVYVKKIQE